MSLMLNALKRIEAKQTHVRAGNAAGPDKPIAFPSAAALAEPIEPPPALRTSDLASLPLEDFAPPEPVSPEATIDQLQAFVSAAGLLDGCEPPLDTTDFHDAAEPLAVMPGPPDPYVATAQKILRQLPRGRSQALLFTSPADGQGTTMTVARLAPRLAQSVDGNVLVVDVNFRNPDMARWLAVAPAWCLLDVIAGAADWATAVQMTAHERVSLLPGGTDSQVRGLGRDIQGVSYLLRELTGHYDLVLVDASSLAHRDTVRLAAVCDATYLVVRLGEGSPRMLREAAQVIQRNGGRLLGCVAIDGGMRRE